MSPTRTLSNWSFAHIQDPSNLWLKMYLVWCIWWCHQQELRAMATKLLVLKASISLLNLVKFWDQLDFRWALRVFLYPWVVKKSFIENWVGVVILAVMGQSRFLIQCFCSTFFLFDFLNKKLIYYFYFNFFLFCFCWQPWATVLKLDSSYL